MYGFQNEDFLKTLNGAVAQIGEINRIADKVSDLGYKNIYLVGTGGTYAIISPLAYMLKTNSTLVWYHEIAAELLAAKPRFSLYHGLLIRNHQGNHCGGRVCQKHGSHSDFFCGGQDRSSGCCLGLCG